MILRSPSSFSGVPLLYLLFVGIRGCRKEGKSLEQSCSEGRFTRGFGQYQNQQKVQVKSLKVEETRQKLPLLGEI